MEQVFIDGKSIIDFALTTTAPLLAAVAGLALSFLLLSTISQLFKQFLNDDEFRKKIEDTPTYRIHPNLVERFKDGLAILYYRYRSIIRNTRKGRK